MSTNPTKIFEVWLWEGRTAKWYTINMIDLTDRQQEKRKEQLTSKGCRYYGMFHATNGRYAITQAASHRKRTKEERQKWLKESKMLAKV